MFFYKIAFWGLLHLSDVMCAKVVNQAVKSLLEFRAVFFGKLSHCYFKLFVQFGSAAHSVAVPSEKPDKRETQIRMKEVNQSVVFI